MTADRSALSRINQHGVALVLVLWITVLLTIMAGAFTLTIQREAKLIGNLKTRSEANALAEAGLNYALLMLSVNDPQKAWKADRSFYELPFHNGVIKIQIGDERGKIDLNFAGRNLLLKMFTGGINLESSAAEKLTDAILDWRDKNDEAQANGAEQKDYQQNNLPYAPRNGPFQSIEELQFVLGMTPQLFKAVEPMLTVYSGRAAVDKTKAPPDVLKVLTAAAETDMSKQSTQNVNEGDTQETAAEDSEMAENTRTDTDMEPGSETDVKVRGGFPEGSIYSIDAAALISSEHAGQIRIVVQRETPEVFKILSWKYVTAHGIPFTSGNYSEE